MASHDVLLRIAGQGRCRSDDQRASSSRADRRRSCRNALRSVSHVVLRASGSRGIRRNCEWESKKMKGHAFRTIAIVALCGVIQIPMRVVSWCMRVIEDAIERCVWED